MGYFYFTVNDNVLVLALMMTGQANNDHEARSNAKSERKVSSLINSSATVRTV